MEGQVIAMSLCGEWWFRSVSLFLNDQIDFLLGEKKDNVASLEYLMSKRQKVLDFVMLPSDASMLERVSNSLKVSSSACVSLLFCRVGGISSQTSARQMLPPK